MQIRLARRGLRQSRRQGALQIRSAADPAVADEGERLLDVRRSCRARLRSEQVHFGIEQQQVERIGGAQAAQRGLAGGKAALQLVPLHGERIVEQHDQRAGGLRTLCRPRGWRGMRSSACAWKNPGPAALSRSVITRSVSASAGSNE